MNGRKLSAVLAVAALLLSLAACSPAPSAASSPPAVSAGEQTAANATDAPVTDPKLDKSEYYEIVLYQESFDQKNEDLASQSSFRKYLKDNFNFGYKQVPYPGDPQEKLTLMLSAGDYPDLVRLYSTKMIQAYVNAGALIELGPLAEEYGKDFLKTHETHIPIWTQASGMNDGKLWIYDTWTPDMTMGVSNPHIEWVVRSDILKQQGYPDIANEDDLFAVLQKGLQDNPKTDSMKTVGIAFPMAAYGTTGEEVMTSQYSMGRLDRQTGNVAQSVFDPDVKKFIDVCKDFSFREGMLFFNHAYNAGLLDKEALTDDYDAYAAKMNSGIALSNWFMNWERDDWNKSLQDAGKDYRYVPVSFMLKGQAERGETKNYWVGMDVAWQSLAITKNAKFPERLMEVINYCTSEEGLVRMGWGEEGVQYTVVDGKRVPTQDYYDKIQNDPDYIYTFSSDDQLGLFNGLDANGQPYIIGNDPDVVARRMDPIVLSTLQAYGFNSYSDLYHKNKNVTYNNSLNIDFKTASPDFTDEQNKQVEKVQAVFDDYIAKLVTAKDDATFDSLLAEMNAKRDAEGAADLIAAWNEQYSALCQQFNVVN